MNKEKEICGNQRNLRITNKDLDMAKQESLFKTKVVPGKPVSGNLFDEEIVTCD